LEFALRPDSNRDDVEWDDDVAVRYRVERSDQLPEGQDVVVFRALHGTACGGGTHEVGQRGVVIATETAGVLTTSSCLRLNREETAEVLAHLRLPPDFLTRDDRTPRDCDRPTSVAQAYEAADAVAWTDAEHSCWNDATGRVESASRARVSWKGPTMSEWFIVSRAPDVSALGEDKLPVIFEATGHLWPPGEFLRAIPPPSNSAVNWYANDGCLVPLPPQDANQAVRELQSLMVIPPGTGALSPAGSVPQLTCARIGPSVFEDAERRMAAHRKQRQAALQGVSTVPRVAPRGACGSCYILRDRPLPPGVLLLMAAGLAGLGIRRAAKRLQMDW
jgi:hypothetical protein